MSVQITKANTLPSKGDVIFLFQQLKEVEADFLSKDQKAYLQQQFEQDKAPDFVALNLYGRFAFFVQAPKATSPKEVEDVRQKGHKVFQQIVAEKLSKVTISDQTGEAKMALALAEGVALSSYQFLKYFKDVKNRKHNLKSIALHAKKVDKSAIAELNNLVEATMAARTLVNEPLSFLTAVQFSKEMQKLGKASGFKVEVFNKKKIEALKMGGLLAVNAGSIDPPTFTIMEWKPKNAQNKQPIVLVGKGIVYDTGGLSLKPTPNSMDIMKCDMGGAAAMVGTMVAVAKNELPLHVIALVPATDNRPGGNAYAPGDVIKMHNGMHVEVLNTDAEGRMVMADALSYAVKYKPQLVFDAATLTGAAVRAIGTKGVVAMGTAEQEVMDAFKSAGNEVYERVVEFPFWEEYGEEIKSKIADIKNIGGPTAGAITAGKFLEHFTDYPWVHFDIAGPAWLDNAEGYRTQGGTGAGVRLFYTFLKNQCK